MTRVKDKNGWRDATPEEEIEIEKMKFRNPLEEIDSIKNDILDLRQELKDKGVIGVE